MRFVHKWTQCIVESIRDVTPQIREITLRPDGFAIPHYPAGSHLDVGTIIDGQPATRSYSLVGEPMADRYRIGVRLAPDSRGGSRYMWALRPGARLDVTLPRNNFEVDWQREHYCLIAGGVGITPILGIAATLIRRGAQVQLHYAVRSRKDAAFLAELAALLGDRLQLYRSDEGQRLDLGRTIAKLPPAAMAVLCGPMRLLDDARQCWREAGRPLVDLRFETFGSSGLLPTADFRVRINSSGAEIVVPRDRSMLDALNAAGFEVISDCERGECGICAINVVAIDGEIDHRDVFFSDHQKQCNEKICPCVSRAIGTLTVDTLSYGSGAPR